MSEHARCRWCGAERHVGLACPIVKAMNFDRRGKIVRVEFLTVADLPRQQQPASEQDYPRLNPIEEE